MIELNKFKNLPIPKTAPSISGAKRNEKQLSTDFASVGGCRFICIQFLY